MPTDSHLLRPDEVVSLARCLYRCYGYTYVDDFYYPDKIRQMLESDRLLSMVMADEAGDLTASGIRNAFEKFDKFSTGGLAPPLTFTSTDHRASMAAKIYQVQGGKFVPVSDWVELPRDMEYFGK